MLYRIKQFYRGLFAKVTPEDLHFLKTHLTGQEITLFRRLRISEQRHCLNIAYDCLSEENNKPHLIKAALLHDVGKTKSNLTLVNKALVVLIKKLRLPGKILPKFLTKALYYKEQHPAIGAELLQQTGTEASVIFLTRYHHRDLQENPINVEEYTDWNMAPLVEDDLPDKGDLPDEGDLATDVCAKKITQRPTQKELLVDNLRELTVSLTILQKIDEKN